MKILRGPLLVAFAGVVGLAACGGGGDVDAGGGTGGAVSGGGTGSGAVAGGGTGSGTTVVGSTTTPDGRVLAGSQGIMPVDYLGRSFPLSFIFGDDGPPNQPSVAGVAQLEVVDFDTVVIIRDGVRRSFFRSAGNDFRDGSGRFLQVNPAGALRVVWLTDGASGLLGTFGFETPVAARPLSANFNGRSISSLFVDTDGVDVVLGMTAHDTVDLQATFTGSGGTITGTLFDGSEFTDLDGDGLREEELFVRTSLNGTIAEGGFTGTISGSASAEGSFGGSSVDDLNVIFSSSSVNGKFFGTAAQAASGTYSADTVTTPGFLPPTTGRVAGLFVVNR